MNCFKTHFRLTPLFAACGIVPLLSPAWGGGKDKHLHTTMHGSDEFMATCTSLTPNTHSVLFLKGKRK
jgi:hypothetical protein